MRQAHDLASICRQPWQVSGGRWRANATPHIRRTSLWFWGRNKPNKIGFCLLGKSRTNGESPGDTQTTLKNRRHLLQMEVSFVEVQFRRCTWRALQATSRTGTSPHYFFHHPLNWTTASLRLGPCPPKLGAPRCPLGGTDSGIPTATCSLPANANTHHTSSWSPHALSFAPRSAPNR